MINKTDDKTIINDMRLLAINEAKIIVDSNKTSNTSILKFLILLKVKILISEKIKNFCIPTSYSFRTKNTCYSPLPRLIS